MAEHVQITIDIDVKDTYEIDRVRAKLEGLRLEAEALDDHMKNMSGHTDNLNKSFKDLDKEVVKKQKDFDGLSSKLDKTSRRFDRVSKSSMKTSRTLRFFDKVIGGLAKFLQKTMAFAFKGFLVNLALGIASLLAVNLAFKAGAGMIRIWNSALTISAAAGASFIAVLSGIAAAQRQYSAALQASNYGGGSKGATQANTEMRALQKNAALASLGAEALAGAFAAISSQTQVTGVLQRALTVMGDFAVASGDPVKGLQAAGNFLGLLTKKGSITQEVLDAATEVGPQFVESLSGALKDGRIKTDAASIIKGLLGGAFEGDAVGGLDVVSGTVVGTIKTQFERLKSEFADLGQNFLPEFTTAISRMGNIVSTALIKISGAITQWGKGSLVDGLVGGFEKITTWVTDLFLNKLPKAIGMWERFKETLKGIGEWFVRVRESMRPLLDGAKVLTEVFGPVFRQIWAGFTGGVKTLSSLLIENRSTVEDFGNGLMRFIKSFGELFGTLKTTFIQLLPVLTTILDVVGNIASAISDVVGGLNKLGGGGAGGSAVAAAGLIAAYVGLGAVGKIGKKGAKGTFGGKGVGGSGGLVGGGAMGVVNMTATTVYLTGAVAPGPVPPAPGSPGALPAAARPSLNSRFASAAKSPTGYLIRAAGVMTGASIATNARTSSGAMTGGAIAGASIGAGGGLPGILIGAAAGAIVGGIYDEIWGEARRHKEDARDLADSLINTAHATIIDALGNNNIKKARDQMNDVNKRLDYFKTIHDAYGDGSLTVLSQIGLPKAGETVQTKYGPLTLTADDLKALYESPGTLVDATQRAYDDLLADITPKIVMAERNLDRLGFASGFSDDKINALANSLEIDLSSGIASVQFVLEELLGVAIPRAADMAMASLDAFLMAVDNVTLPIIDQQKALEAVNQGADDLYEKVDTNVQTGADFADFLRTAVTYELGQTRDPITGETDPGEAMSQMMAKFGTPGGLAFAEGEVFSEKGQQMAPIFGEMIGQIFSDWTAQHGRELVGRIATDLVDLSGGGAALDISRLTEADFAGLSNEQMDKLTQILDSGLAANAADPTESGTFPNAAALVAALQDIGLDVTVGVPVATQEALDTARDQRMEDAWLGVTAAGTALDGAAAHLNELVLNPPIVNVTTNVHVDAMGKVTTISTFSSPLTPAKDGGPLGVYPPMPDLNGDGKPGDTATSRLANTLGFHSKLNPLLRGKRIVSSSLRDFGLGSLGSDHATGAAYDLTGQNLGAYGNNVNAMGGFAEMHGRGDQRHLHVVPPSGDTATPATVGANNSMALAPVVMHIYPSPGMDETAFANKVAAIVDRRDRNIRERTSK